MITIHPHNIPIPGLYPAKPDFPIPGIRINTTKITGFASDSVQFGKRKSGYRRQLAVMRKRLPLNQHVSFTLPAQNNNPELHGIVTAEPTTQVGQKKIVVAWYDPKVEKEVTIYIPPEPFCISRYHEQDRQQVYGEKNRDRAPLQKFLAYIFSRVIKQNS